MTGVVDQGDAMPPFTIAVPDTGYRWWYVDGLSDCGRFGVVVIAFIGSVFSPYYHRARARGRGDPLQHCSINVALYTPGRKYWAMTERGAGAVEREPHRLRIGPSRLLWRGDSLLIDVDERTAPFARRLRGQVRVDIPHASGRRFPLDERSRHTWQPIAANAGIEVDFTAPDLAWRGHGYLDTNAGQRPLEADFRRWDWCRLRSAHATHIYYDVVERGGRRRSLALGCHADGHTSEAAAGAVTALGGTGWRVHRETRCPGDARVAATLEDTPFYARSVLRVDREATTDWAMHESLSLERFSKPWVRLLLPFRMPRFAGRR